MTDEKLTQHFTLSELIASDTATRQGIDNYPDAAAIANIRNFLAPGLEQVRVLLGHPIVVSSGYRSPKINRIVGGSKTSDHMFGRAADFTCRGYGTPLEVCRAIVASGIIFDQLIYEGTWVHISFGPKPRNQVLTAVFNRGYPATYFAGLAP